jgi:cytoskeletal protein CcmA (bactofilin family)
MIEPRRRLFERRLFERLLFEGTSVTPTFIGAASVVVGNIRGAGQFVVSGEVHGDGELDGGLNLSVTGSWHGNIRARQAIIAGKIVGGLQVEGTLEIGYTAVIRGRVSARTVAIAKGAIVDGEIEVTSGAPVHEFEEKREGK